MTSNIVIAIIITSLATYLSRFLGVVSAEKIKETSNNTEDIIEILEKGSHAANDSMLSTKEMLSKKGRSSKLGERRKGHIDPGAASSALIFRTFHEAVQNL